MKKILVVEDEDSFRTLLDRIMRRAGWQPSFAVNGEAATKLLEKETFDCVVTDWNMPKMDGGQLVRWIRKNPKVQRMPVLMLTVRTKPEEEVQGFECGADDYLCKPYSPKELTARVARLVGAPV
ncbi:MAG: response regulator transcription factor [Elusimicrobia bacterium]|nr:response regulator transcription factor [Elusimicrobiota bacterium]